MQRLIWSIHGFSFQGRRFQAVQEHSSEPAVQEGPDEHHIEGRANQDRCQGWRSLVNWSGLFWECSIFSPVPVACLRSFSNLKFGRLVVLIWWSEAWVQWRLFPKRGVCFFSFWNFSNDHGIDDHHCSDCFQETSLWLFCDTWLGVATSWEKWQRRIMSSCTLTRRWTTGTWSGLCRLKSQPL
jgi:hypothetical protein